MNSFRRVSPPLQLLGESGNVLCVWDRFMQSYTLHEHLEEGRQTIPLKVQTLSQQIAKLMS